MAARGAGRSHPTAYVGEIGDGVVTCSCDVLHTTGQQQPVAADAVVPSSVIVQRVPPVQVRQWQLRQRPDESVVIAFADGFAHCRDPVVLWSVGAILCNDRTAHFCSHLTVQITVDLLHLCCTGLNRPCSAGHYSITSLT